MTGFILRSKTTHNKEETNKKLPSAVLTYVYLWSGICEIAKNNFEFIKCRSLLQLELSIVTTCCSPISCGQ